MILLVVHYEFILHSTTLVAKTCQLLTEIQNTVNSSPVTLGKVAAMLLYMRIHSHQILVNIRFGIPYLNHAPSTVQR